MTTLLIIGIIWLLLYLLLRRLQPARASDLLAGAILFLCTIGFFWRTLSGDVYQPADGGDLVSFLYPTYRFAASQLQQWTLPLWNPHLYGGAPFISDIQAGFLYPPNLLLFLLWPDFDYSAMQWLVVGHIWWAGLGIYFLLRAIRWDDQPIQRPAALFGAIAFQFSDPLLIHLGNLNLIAVLSWLPWVLGATVLALNRTSTRWAILAACLFTTANYAGHAQSSLYIGLAVGLYTVLNCVTRVAIPTTTIADKQSALLKHLALLCTIFALTILLTAPILLPALELTQFTERSDLTYQDTVNFSLAPTQAIGLITPSFFGRGPALHWSLWQRVETPYAGIATLILAAAALLFIRVHPRSSASYNSPPDLATRINLLLPWIGIALFGLLTALGVYAILHGWLTAIVPGFDLLRAPARALVLWTLGLSILAAFGVDSLMQATKVNIEPLQQAFLKPGALILAGLFTPLLYLALLLTQQEPTAFLRASVAALAITTAAAFWLATWALLAAYQAQWFTPKVVAGLLIALLFLDLSATGAYTDISPDDPTRGYHHPEIINYLKGDADLFRIDSMTDIELIWQPDATALHGLQDIGGIANPLMLHHWERLRESTGGRHTRLYDMLNVKYVLVQDGTPLPDGKFELALDAPGELSLYRNLRFMPRAWLVHEVLPAPPDSFREGIGYTIENPTEFDPSQVAYVTGELPQLEPAQGPEVVQMLHYGSSEMRLQVEATASGLLVLSEVWYPGWAATVDGVEVPILQVNGAQRGVVVPEGMSVVVLRFRPSGWWY